MNKYNFRKLMLHHLVVFLVILSVSSGHVEVKREDPAGPAEDPSTSTGVTPSEEAEATKNPTEELTDPPSSSSTSKPPPVRADPPSSPSNETYEPEPDYDEGELGPRHNKPASTVKSTGRVEYRGKLLYNSKGCLTEAEIEQIQKSDMATSEKKSILNARTCDWKRYLECYSRMRSHDKEGQPLGNKRTIKKCKCMKSRMGKKAIFIKGYCFIPAGLGRFSTCVSKQEAKRGAGFTLLSGHKIVPKCVPQSFCGPSKYYLGNTCTCYEMIYWDRVKGTCSKAPTSLSFYINDPYNFWKLIHILIILMYGKII